MNEALTSLNIAGLVLALFFIALLLSKKEKQIRDYLLAFFILLLGTFLLIKYVFQHDLYHTWPIIIYLDVCYWVLLGPTLYVYTLVSTRGENFLRTKYLFTLIPFVLVIIGFSPYLFGNPTGLFDDQFNNMPVIVKAGYYIWLFNSPVFYALTIIAINQHQQRIKNNFSYSRNIDLKWLNYLSHGFAVFILFLILRGPVKSLFGLEYPVENYSVSLFVVFLYIFGIGFYGYRQRGIFEIDDPDNNPMEKPDVSHNGDGQHEPGRASYQKSGLNDKEAREILDKLNTLMKNEQLYLDSELHLSVLAHKLGVSSHKISQVLNEYLHKNFFDYINEFRVEKVKECLTDPANLHLKIVSLAYDCGFSSKSTFYKCFKKSEGITPAKYQQQNL